MLLAVSLHCKLIILKVDCWIIRNVSSTVLYCTGTVNKMFSATGTAYRWEIGGRLCLKIVKIGSFLPNEYYYRMKLLFQHFVKNLPPIYHRQAVAEHYGLRKTTCFSSVETLIISKTLAWSNAMQKRTAPAVSSPQATGPILDILSMGPTTLLSLSGSYVLSKPLIFLP
jgi:hypothetical protein